MWLARSRRGRSCCCSNVMLMIFVVGNNLFSRLQRSHRRTTKKKCQLQSRFWWWRCPRTIKVWPRDISSVMRGTRLIPFCGSFGLIDFPFYPRTSSTVLHLFASGGQTIFVIGGRLSREDKYREVEGGKKGLPRAFRTDKVDNMKYHSAAQNNL